MKTLRTIGEVRAHVADVRHAGRRIGLVPTMGAFHAGHEALMRAARATCDEVIVSLFVNPTQFNEPSDLDAYPRTEESDAATAAALGVDVLFAPPAAEIYPDGFATTIHVDGLTNVLEGAQRGAGHFDGVCTVVCKLFTIVAPDVAYFGQKDAQQVVVIRRMVRDLEPPGPDRDRPDRARARRAGDVLAQRAPRPRGPAEARSRCAAAWTRCAPRSRRE